QPTNGNVYVCPGDTVLWRARTSGTNPQSEMFVGQVILDANNPPQTFDTQNGNYAGGTVASDAQLTQPNYSVAVLDRNSSSLYIDNTPRIIIGTGGASGTLIRQVDEIQNQAGQLLDLLVDEPKATKARDQAKQIVADVTALKAILESK